MNDWSDELEGLWIRTISYLEKQLSVPEYGAWIEPIRPVSFNNNQLVLQVPSDLAREKVEQKYLELLRYSFQKTIGKDLPDLKINLLVDADLTYLIPSSPPEVVVQPNDLEKPYLNPRYTFSFFVVSNE